MLFGQVVNNVTQCFAIDASSKVGSRRKSMYNNFGENKVDRHT